MILDNSLKGRIFTRTGPMVTEISDGKHTRDRSFDSVFCTLIDITPTGIFLMWIERASALNDDGYIHVFANTWNDGNWEDTTELYESYQKTLAEKRNT